MGGNWIGMDVAEVNTLAQTFTNEANKIEQEIITMISTKLHGTTWQGQDRNQFESDWNSTLVHQLRTVATALRDAATTANRNAAAQTSVSSTLT